MEQQFFAMFATMDIEAEKSLLNLPAELMHEVFGPLDARSLLETAKSHRILGKQVKDWPDKRWNMVHLSKYETIIDYETFDRKDAEILLQGAEYRQEETSVNISDLPYGLLWAIMEPLDVPDLLSVAKAHPNLLRATRNLRDKRFETVKFSPGMVIFTEYASSVPYLREVEYTPGEADILLAGSSVDKLKYVSQPNITPDILVRSLTFDATQKDAHRCVELIKKWQPSKVAFRSWDTEAFSTNMHLAQGLKDVGQLELGALTVEWLSCIPDWKFTSLECRLCSGGRNVRPQIQALGQKLYEQWSAKQRNSFRICIDLDSELGALQIADSSRLVRFDGETLRWSVSRGLHNRFSMKSLCTELSYCLYAFDGRAYEAYGASTSESDEDESEYDWYY